MTPHYPTDEWPSRLLVPTATTTGWNTSARMATRCSHPKRRQTVRVMDGGSLSMLSADVSLYIALKKELYGIDTCGTLWEIYLYFMYKCLIKYRLYLQLLTVDSLENLASVAPSLTMATSSEQRSVLNATMDTEWREAVGLCVQMLENGNLQSYQHVTVSGTYHVFCENCIYS